MACSSKVSHFLQESGRRHASMTGTGSRWDEGGEAGCGGRGGHPQGISDACLLQGARQLRLGHAGHDGLQSAFPHALPHPLRGAATLRPVPLPQLQTPHSTRRKHHWSTRWPVGVTDARAEESRDAGTKSEAAGPLAVSDLNGS